MMTKTLLRQLVRKLFTGRSRKFDYKYVMAKENEFYRRYLQTGMTVFDIGANVGELTRLFSDLVGEAGTVHAFEATATTYKTLIENCRNLSNVTCNHLAIADESGSVELNIYDEAHASWNTLASRPLDVQPISTETVTSITIDDYCERNQIKQIDLLKIDVEGAEYQVLLGARRMLDAHQIRCCIFEYGGTTFDMGNHPDEIERYLLERGYSISNLIEGEPLFPGRLDPAKAQFAMHIAVAEGL
jgi:FkbM family methyltransferase